MYFKECAICHHQVHKGNWKLGICADCWQKIEEGHQKTLNQYLSLDLRTGYYI